MNRLVTLSPWIRCPLAAALVSWLGVLSSEAHPSDVSYLRAHVEPHQWDFQFSFNLLTLTQFVPLDRNGDHRIDTPELEAAMPELLIYLREHVLIRLNDKEASLGEALPWRPLWIEKADSLQVTATDDATRYIGFSFRGQDSPLIENLQLDFGIFDQTGPLHTTEATFEQGDLRLQVPFTKSEPDYTYDTGFGTDALFHASASKSAPGNHLFVLGAIVVLLLSAACFLRNRMRNQRPTQAAHGD